MDSKEAQALREKYWNGSLSPKDEKALKTYFSEQLDSNDPEHAYFNYLIEKGDQNKLGDQFDQEILHLIDSQNKPNKLYFIGRKYWYAAATLALIISLSIIFKKEINPAEKAENVVVIDTYTNPEKAFEETKKALLMLSSRLNQSGEYATKFSKFEESQKQLKQN